jgi:hypothetical protein
MKIAKHAGWGFAQGDCVFIPIKDLPADVVEQRRAEDGRLIVAHSETGHHHAIDNPEARLFDKVERDPMVCYLAIDGECAELVHHRAHDTHETVQLGGGIWEVHRQEEYTPQGWRQVQD